MKLSYSRRCKSVTAVDGIGLAMGSTNLTAVNELSYSGHWKSVTAVDEVEL
jgi:hypothetical protein